ncbi:lytic murein transglycosylase [Catellatospora sp. KI3]|uniref:lytic murein transglycosylase n=1 Tax=Catellatospora sp. KI3 TaxID=3041620 RepID=UPI00248306EB|nr:lytic murein transglycosylase [Catellatospora sp. KI3]MDI1460149.1 lytic murein transglycosylase [Catellatospora sp. KI3]
MRDGEEAKQASVDAEPAATSGARSTPDSDATAAAAADATAEPVGAPDAGEHVGAHRAAAQAVRASRVVSAVRTGLPRLRDGAMHGSRVAWDGVRRGARKPYGRLTTAGLTIIALVAATATAGALLIPALVSAKAAPAPTPSAETAPTAAPTASELPLPTLSPPPTGVPRPAAAFHRWAEQQSVKVQVPVPALEAYAYAEYVLGTTRPACHLNWTTLAAIGQIESDHGRTKGARLDEQGRALPPIIGPALNGSGNLGRVKDTDAGALDNDKTWDHAVGPMQFIPATWRSYAVDADSDQLADPHDLDDAALAAAYYLCAPGKDLRVVANWKAVVLSYNNIGVYLQKVYDTAQAYGAKSRA